jgi:hypothetical protein
MSKRDLVVQELGRLSAADIDYLLRIVRAIADGQAEERHAALAAESVWRRPDRIVRR